MKSADAPIETQCSKISIRLKKALPKLCWNTGNFSWIIFSSSGERSCRKQDGMEPEAKVIEQKLTKALASVSEWIWAKVKAFISSSENWIRQSPSPMKCPISLVPIVVVIVSVVMGIKGRGLFERCRCGPNFRCEVVTLAVITRRGPLGTCFVKIRCQNREMNLSQRKSGHHRV